jgi:hypothetical protein
MTFPDRYNMLKSTIEEFLYNIDRRSVVNFDILREGLIRAASNYIDPKDGDVVCIEWSDGDHTHHTKIGAPLKNCSLTFYNNKWFVVLGEDGAKSDWIYQPLFNIDTYARVIKVE